MGFKDLVKGVANKTAEMASAASQKVMDGVAQAQENAAAKKEAEAAYNEEMNGKSSEMAKALFNQVHEKADANSKGYFSGLSEDYILSFAKDFFEKILLPANSTAYSYISMYPYIDEKKIKKFVVSFPTYSTFEKPIIYLIDKENQEFILTTTNFYFKVCLEEDRKFFAVGSIPCDKISQFSMDRDNEIYLFKCNNVKLASLKITNTYESDFITMNNFFESFEKQDFEITEEEIEGIIRKKIGENIYNKIKGYILYENEKLIYFAWGLDSLTAKDYIVCTTKQIIIMNRELFGATANVKQFYYEDITSMTTVQNRAEDSLLTMLLTAAFKQCDLAIYVSGAMEKIQTLNKVEAERVIRIYQIYRKSIKEEARQPQVIIQQQAAQPQPVADDPLAQLEKLAALKDKGILSESEFAAKKAEILAKI